jgi:hypothetical protein
MDQRCEADGLSVDRLIWRGRWRDVDDPRPRQGLIDNLHHKAWTHLFAPGPLSVINVELLERLDCFDADHAVCRFAQALQVKLVRGAERIAKCASFGSQQRSHLSSIEPLASAIRRYSGNLAGLDEGQRRTVRIIRLAVDRFTDFGNGRDLSSEREPLDAIGGKNDGIPASQHGQPGAAAHRGRSLSGSFFNLSTSGPSFAVTNRERSIVRGEVGAGG